MAKVTRGKVEGKVDSVYRLVLIAAERAKQLSRGAKPLVVTETKKPPVIALEEILAEKVHYEVGKASQNED